jgi:hypothetical protein
MRVKMTFKKATKNTYVFEANGTCVPTLYIQKLAFEKQPKVIFVNIEVVE